MNNKHEEIKNEQQSFSVEQSNNESRSKEAKGQAQTGPSETSPHEGQPQVVTPDRNVDSSVRPTITESSLKSTCLLPATDQEERKSPAAVVPPADPSETISSEQLIVNNEPRDGKPKAAITETIFQANVTADVPTDAAAAAAATTTTTAGGVSAPVNKPKSHEEYALLLEAEAQGNEVFTFGQHRGEKFCVIARDDPGYHVRYMVMLNRKGQEPFGTLARCINWFNRWSRVFSSKKRTSATALQQQQQSAAKRRQLYNSSSYSGNHGNEVFPFGQHCGQTFRQVVAVDPSYHLRYKDMDDSPNEVLDQYIEWFNNDGPGHHMARAAHRDDFKYSLGLFCCFNEYDE